MPAAPGIHTQVHKDPASHLLPAPGIHTQVHKDTQCMPAAPGMHTHVCAGVVAELSLGTWQEQA